MVRTDKVALKEYANSGIGMFWFRQFMFIGATILTTTYLSSFAPIACYLACLSGEIAEAYFTKKIVANDDWSEDRIVQFTRAGTFIAAWSSITVSAFAIIVAYLGEDAFLFVPMIYVFAAAHYATIFNPMIGPVLVARISIYFLAFVILGALGPLMMPDAKDHLNLTVFVTGVSVAIFFVINAVLFRRNYLDRRKRTARLVEREEMLNLEIERRERAVTARESIETRFKTLFDFAPIPIREEDLSGMKRLIDQLNIEDTDEFDRYLDDNPEFLDACGRTIVVLDANKAALDEHGYQDKSVMLKNVVRKLSPEAKKFVRRTLHAIHRGLPGLNHETRITRADGDVRAVSAHWSVLPGHEDTYSRILLCSVDLTERLAAEEALRQAQKMEAVGQLTGGIAHDFNNLLMVIRGNMDLMARSSEFDHDLAKSVNNAVQRGAEMTNRLLAFSRNQPLSSSVVDVEALITKMQDILQRSIGERNVIELQFPEDLWRVHADEGQLEGALLNLALNARNAMPDSGTLRIWAKNEEVGLANRFDLQPGQYVKLTVADNGEGMSTEVINKSIEPFFTTSKSGQGSGLGLSMVYGFLKQSKGALSIRSSVGSGTEIELFLPRAFGSVDAPSTSKSAQPSKFGHGQTILVLEDNADVQAYLNQLLNTSGYQALCASSVDEARAFLATHKRISLLLSDITLPGKLQGPDFAIEFITAISAAPVIFMSGQTDELLSLEDGYFRLFDILAKPFSGSEVLDAVYRALNQPDT